MLEIVNRTSYHSHLQKPPTPIQMPIATIREEPKSQAQTLAEFASNLRAKKASYQPKMLKKPEPPAPVKVESVQEVAERIKQNRLKRKENAPLPVEKELKVVYRNDDGIECVGYPTDHCISQFAKRIRIIKPHLNFNSRKEVLLSLAEHFNKAKRDGSNEYVKRNARRHDPTSPFAMIGRWYAFIVKPDGTILTFELGGKYRHMNKIHSVKKNIDSQE